MNIKRLYRNIRSITHDQCSIIDIEKATIISKGSDTYIFTYDLGVHWALEIADEYAEKGTNSEIVDLRSLPPIDWKMVIQSVQKTGKVLLLQEPSEILGSMSEI